MFLKNEKMQNQFLKANILYYESWYLQIGD